MGQPGLRQGIHADTQYVELGCAKTLPRHVRVCPKNNMEPTNPMVYHSFPIFSEGAPESFLVILTNP